MNQALNFDLNEIILCYHGPYIYEAKILKAENWNGVGGSASGPHYFVHYKGWNEKWDEWVGESRILKFTEENLTKQRSLLSSDSGTAAGNPTANANGSSAGSNIGGSSAQKPKRSEVPPSNTTKRASATFASPSAFTSPSPAATPVAIQGMPDTNILHSSSKRASVTKKVDYSPYVSEASTEDFLGSAPSSSTPIPIKSSEPFKLYIPDSLKVILLYDWESITKNQKVKFQPLVRLPADVNVTTLLENYMLWTTNNPQIKTNSEVIKGICGGIKNCFDIALGRILLWNFERVQYKELLKNFPNQKMSDLYGPEHCLRLLTKFPSIIMQNGVKESFISAFKEHLSIFLKYLESNADELFIVTNYEYAPPEYILKSKNL